MQIPTDVPKPQNNTAIDFTSPWEVAVFIIAPVLIFIVYFKYRNKRKKK